MTAGRVAMAGGGSGATKYELKNKRQIVWESVRACVYVC